MKEKAKKGVGLESIVPSPDLIAKELMQHFGGHDLKTRHEMELSVHSGTNTFLHKGDMSNTHQISRDIDAFSSITAPAGHKPTKVQAREERIMKGILDNYGEIMNSGKAA